MDFQSRRNFPNIGDDTSLTTSFCFKMNGFPKWSEIPPCMGITGLDSTSLKTIA